MATPELESLVASLTSRLEQAEGYVNTLRSALTSTRKDVVKLKRRIENLAETLDEVIDVIPETKGQ